MGARGVVAHVLERNEEADRRAIADQLGKGGAADLVREHLNFGSSYDGSLATTEWYSQTRIVCNNTLRIALSEGNFKVKTYHRQAYDKAKSDAALFTAEFAAQMKLADEMARCEVSPVQVQDFLSNVYCGKTVAAMNEDEETRKQVERMLRRVLPSLNDAPGAQLATAKGTLWGAVNAVTYDIDHIGTQHTDDARAVSAMFGKGADIKARAWSLAKELVAA